ncbi:MAG: hypothetical protein BMS9Abin22_409 [Gammaproteobacteria bacterium]|nr:MAG: hypothetical protein BMS9Abin22_409 [Gammaproteobacteria bacterium]
MVKDPVCGMEIDANSAATQEDYQGATWYFCSESCHGKFRADPAQYARPETLSDPVCGMEVSKDSGYHTEYAGQNYYFCSESCLGKFEAERGRYA